MKKQVLCTFEYRDDVDGDTNKIKTYSKPVTLPEQAPIAFHALSQFSYYLFWQEKKALAARVEELEAVVNDLEELREMLLSPSCDFDPMSKPVRMLNQILVKMGVGEE